jgi:phosphatidylserine/phosphatidylglycerophosphate/cardiolipin synthase-like enzyme
MSTNFFDVLMMWLGSGPSAPKYCQVFANNVTRSIQFGDESGGVPSDLLEMTLGVIGAKIASPTNALVWHVPDLTTSDLTNDEKAQLRSYWPPLRHLSGAAFTPEDARGAGVLEAILLEVFPQAFRRLEYLFSSLEVPVSMDDWDIPRAATPRWFWIYGFGLTGIRDRFQAIATAQWQPLPPPTIDGFMKGLTPIYLDAGEDFGGAFEDGDHIQVRAFDSTGLPIDPDFVFATFNRLAEDSDFTSLKVDHPEHPPTPYQPADRHVIVFCDQEGNPYTPRPVPALPPPPGDPEAGTVEAERRLLLLTPGTGEFSFPEHGVLIFPAGTGLGGMSGPIGLSMTGTHVRFGPYPNGNLGATITVDFAPHMFLRLQVLDYRDWFPRNPNPRNRLTRYTEGNLITPLVDGATFFHELYRMLRATYKDIDPTSPPESFDPYAPVDDAPPADVVRAGIFLSNAWIEPHAPLLGRRGLIAAPKTQDAAPEDLPAFDDLMANVKFVAARSLPGLVDVPSSIDDQIKWWLVSGDGVLPPGASVELRQLVFADDFHGDDPRLPGEVLNADVFGIVAPFPGEAASSRAFVGTTGRFALPVVYLLGRDPMATLRITLWPPNSTEPVAHTYGEVTLPAPADFMNRPPVDPQVDATGLRLEYSGVPGSVDLVLDQGALKEDRAVVVLNARSGEAVAENHPANPGAEIRIGLTNFAHQDSGLVGFLDIGGSNPAACAYFYELYLGRMPEIDESKIDAQHRDPAEGPAAALEAGVAPAHPTELAGILREAITAGVNVRVLGWRDPTQSARSALRSTLATVNSVNAVFGKRGQAIWDATSRETFHVHHQKGAFLRTASLDFVGFLGGIDILTGRWDTHAHRQPDPERPSSTWHDVQCKVEGKAAWDIYRNFMQRWNAANALPDVVGADPGRTPLPPPDDPFWGPTSVVDDPTMTKADGPHAAQINRTLAPHFDAYGGSAPPLDIVDPVTGDLSVKHTWQELLKVAERYLYIEEQYFWIEDHAQQLHEWLVAKPDRLVFLLMPRRFSDINIADQVHYALRRRALNRLLYGIPEVPDGTNPDTLPGNVAARVALFHLASRENLDPIYVHSKMVIADDTWFTIGSANLTRRSWTFDSEINAACVDVRMRRGGHLSARQLRVDLLAEHLQLQPVETPLIEDPRDAFRLVKEVLAGKRPWMRTHLLKVDLKFTHYGPFPDDFDPILRDAIDLVADTDGTETHFDLGLIDAAGLFNALKDATGGLRYGGLGRLRFTFDVSGLGMPPADVIVRVEMREAAAPPAQQVTMGPWPATGPVDAGLLQIGRDYVVRATALAAATSAPIGTAPELTVHTTDFLTAVDLSF